MIAVNPIQLKKGFTLIEIMIALFIGIFLAAGAAQIFINTNNSNRLQENLSRMQENARFAMHFLREDIQQTGFLGGDCLKNASSITNNLNLLPSPPYNAALHQFTINSFKGAVSGANNVPPPSAEIPYPTDEITLRAFFSTNPQSVSTAMGSTVATVQAKPNSGFNKNDIILITNCRFSDIFQVTNDPALSGDQLEHATGAGPAGTPGNSRNSLDQAYPEGSRLYVLSNGTTNNLTRNYRIEESVGKPSLFRNGDALIGDIENMQIVYGVNTSDVSDADNYNTPNYYTDDIAALTADALEQIKVVRISLLVRSPDDNLVSPRQDYFYNGEDVSGADIPDNRIRRVYTSTIKLRNRENYYP